MDYIKVISSEFKIGEVQAGNIIALLDDGNTLPFIARYRKEQTGGIDDQTLRALCERLTYLKNLENRKGEILRLIEEAGGLTEELAAAVSRAVTLTEAEDLYRPFKKKKSTRASKAKERGLAPLAEAILAGERLNPLDFINEEKGVPNADAAMAGALDIIAEGVSDNAEIRKALRSDSASSGVLAVCAKVAEDSVYAMYYDYREGVAKIPAHRILAIDRGERENILKVSLEVDLDRQLAIVKKGAQIAGARHEGLLSEACEDAYSRLIFPAVTRELRCALTDRACDASIKSFAQNLKPLLMQPPLRSAVIMGLDPGFRTGCKVAVIDENSKVLDTGVVYLTHSERQKEEAKRTLSGFIKKHGVTAIAIGNGTASRETESFAAELIRDFGFSDVSYIIVSEAGASVYSASPLAAAEFPQFDLTLRSAVSIARRLKDPLAELVKIDPQAIGVGQYQHDMPQARLSETLGGVVEDCVNSVGVNLNTASHSLLGYVAGVGAAVAKNIVAYREENGPFTGRKDVLKVPKLGKKAFTQCAGFLRIPGGKDPLDNTGVHPESYKAAAALLAKFGKTPREIGDGVELPEEGLSQLANELAVGLPTLRDIVNELKKPGLDPRDSLPPPLLRSDVLSLDDLTEGMELSGTVRNVIDFGAFIDIGLHEDGLCHISQLCDRFVKHPSDVVSVGDVVKVRVISIDKQKKRIGLSMKSL